mgnify:CR=1 FL=1
MAHSIDLSSECRNCGRILAHTFVFQFVDTHFLYTTFQPLKDNIIRLHTFNSLFDNALHVISLIEFRSTRTLSECI